MRAHESAEEGWNMLQDDVAQCIRVDAVRYRSAQAGVQACRPV
jgi:hypothetical protein